MLSYKTPNQIQMHIIRNAATVCKTLQSPECVMQTNYTTLKHNVIEAGSGLIDQEKVDTFLLEFESHLGQDQVILT